MTIQYNTVAESFFVSLKNELIYFNDYKTRAEAQSDIFQYIEMFYNQQGIHQTLAHTTTPTQKEEYAT